MGKKRIYLDEDDEKQEYKSLLVSPGPDQYRKGIESMAKTGKTNESIRSLKKRNISLFQRFLRSFRAHKGLTMRELSESSGVSASYISDLEKGNLKKPDVKILEKLADSLELDAIERDVLIKTAAGKSLLYTEGADEIISQSILLQKEERLREVYVTSESIMELKNTAFFDSVVDNINRGVAYCYFLNAPHKFRPLRIKLEDMLGKKTVGEKVKCIILQSYFVFQPGHVIIKMADPPELIGLFAKWYCGEPYRIYKMEDKPSSIIYEKYQDLIDNLADGNSYDDLDMGKATWIYPERSLDSL